MYHQVGRVTRPERDIKAERRARIVEAATTFLLSRGTRALTMEALAQAAGLSKVTLYSYFPDRDAVIAAAMAAFLQRMEAASLSALGAHDDPAEAIAAALCAKHGFVQDHVRASPYAAELFAESGRLTAPLIRDLDRRIEVALADLLARSGHADAGSVAALLFGASVGIANHARDGAEADRQIPRLVRAILRPV
jgi:AcrR family transcriptional regulator